MRKHLHYGSIYTFKNLYPQIKKLASAGTYDMEIVDKLSSEEKKEFFENIKTEMPIITFHGSEKLHGENMAICFTEGELWVQGRNQVRTLLGDQNGMARFAEDRKKELVNLFKSLQIDTKKYTIVLDGEWAGGNIQRGNSAVSGIEKSFYLFDHFRIVDNFNDENQQFQSTKDINIKIKDIYKLSTFGSYSITLDTSEPDTCEKELKKLAEKIENASPVARHFNKRDNVGEGAVLFASYKGTTLRLKAKGVKHGGRPKTKKEPKNKVTDKQQIKIDKLAEKVTPVWRITQAIQEQQATEMKHVGIVIKWVMKDIEKEEEQVIIDAELSLKDISRKISEIVKNYYFDTIRNFN